MKRKFVKALIHDMEDIETALDLIIDNIETIADTAVRDTEDLAAEAAGDIQEERDNLQNLRQELIGRYDGLLED